MPPRNPPTDLSLPFEDPTRLALPSAHDHIPKIMSRVIRARVPVLEFVVDGAPVGKARARVRARVTADGQIRANAYTPPNTRAWETAVMLAAMEAMSKEGVREALAGATAYSVSVGAAAPRPQRLCRRKDPDGYLLRTVTPDASNVLKSVEDALQLAHAVSNDCLIVLPECVSLYAPKGAAGHTWVCLYRIDEPLVLG